MFKNLKIPQYPFLTTLIISGEETVLKNKTADIIVLYIQWKVRQQYGQDQGERQPPAGGPWWGLPPAKGREEGWRGRDSSCRVPCMGVSSVKCRGRGWGGSAPEGVPPWVSPPQGPLVGLPQLALFEKLLYFFQLAVSKCSIIYHWHVCDRSQRECLLN